MSQDSDEELFEQLDAYVEALRQGEASLQAELRRRHPGLLELGKFLDTLDSMAIELPQEMSHGLDDSAFPVPEQDGTPDYQTLPEDAARYPRSFGKYELLAEIGRGGMGVVYKAHQCDLDRPVAVKMILASQLASDDEVHRFYEEAKAAGGLRHENIVAVHEVGHVHGQHYFAMDYVDGLSLAQLLADGPVSLDVAARTIATVSHAIEYLHSRGIIHRDLKPGNILIDADQKPFVTDFGLAKVFDSSGQLTRTGTIVGTPSYMAPEQAAGRVSDITPLSDVYSLGAILYVMLTGRPPFQEESPLDTLVQVLEGEPTLPHKLNRAIPRDLELICLRCLEKNPQDRYPSASDLANDLERYLKREPVETRPCGLKHRLRRWARRQPAAASRLAALLLASTIVQIRFMTVGEDIIYHRRVMTILGIWLASTILFQQMLNRERLEAWTRYVWATADTILLTALLFIADAPVGPLLIGYPMLIAASGMFFKVRLVIFTTAVTLIAFGLLVWARPDGIGQLYYGIIYAAVLSVMGMVIAFQIYRVRALSRYFQSRR